MQGRQLHVTLKEPTVIDSFKIITGICPREMTCTAAIKLNVQDKLVKPTVNVPGGFAWTIVKTLQARTGSVSRTEGSRRMPGREPKPTVLRRGVES